MKKTETDFVQISIKGSYGWKTELQALIDVHLQFRVNGNKASHKTQADMASFLFYFFKLLQEEGFGCMPRNLKEKHVQVACAKWEVQKLAASTIQTRLSHLRKFCKWIGKRGMVKQAKFYFKDSASYQRKYSATKDKGFKAAGVDVLKVIEIIRYSDPFAFHQILAIHAFGLRIKEAVCLRPLRDIANGVVFIQDGAKGGKSRVIPIDNDYQQMVAKQLVLFASVSGEHLGNPNHDLAYNLKHISNVAASLGLTKAESGVTLHRLRTDYALDFLNSKGIIASVQVQNSVENDPERQSRQELAYRLGHNRISVTTAYTGAITSRKS